MSTQPRLVAVTGAAGMLGLDVVDELQSRGILCAGLTRTDLDVTDASACHKVLTALRPSAVIHCAAYTDVNRAESEPDLAMRINGEGAGAVAAACRAVGARLVLVSTDYVFDGNSAEPYREGDPVNPINSYGRSKLEGERRALAEAPELCAVARTSWLYGTRGKNFVKTMLSVARSGRPLKVVHDQIGAPTYTRDLARALCDLALAGPEGAGPHATGLFHVTNSGACSWYEFARAIFSLSGVHPLEFQGVGSAEFPTPALRPQNSRLCDTRLRDCGIEPLPPWLNALERYLAEEGELRSPESPAEGAAILSSRD